MARFLSVQRVRASTERQRGRSSTDSNALLASRPNTPGAPSRTIIAKHRREYDRRIPSTEFLEVTPSRDTYSNRQRLPDYAQSALTTTYGQWNVFCFRHFYVIWYVLCDVVYSIKYYSSGYHMNFILSTT